jgi:hypothetical protein
VVSEPDTTGAPEYEHSTNPIGVGLGFAVEVAPADVAAGSVMTGLGLAEAVGIGLELTPRGVGPGGVVHAAANRAAIPRRTLVVCFMVTMIGCTHRSVIRLPR